CPSEGGMGGEYGHRAAWVSDAQRFRSMSRCENRYASLGMSQEEKGIPMLGEADGRGSSTLPRWAMSRIIIINGSPMALRCRTCSSLSVVTVDALAKHWPHLPVEARVLVLGQLELSGLDDAFRNDPRTRAATEWVLEQPARSGESAALAALAGVAVVDLPYPLDSDSRRMLSARAEIRRAEVVNATRRAKAEGTSDGEHREPARHD